MTSKEILDKFKTIAVVGMSNSTDKPARRIPSFLKTKGYEIIPINPMHDKILGMKAYDKIEDVEEKIEILNVFRPSKDVPAIVEQAVKRRKEKGDIDVIWLQQGISDDNAKKKAEENGIEFLQDTCIYTEYTSSH